MKSRRLMFLGLLLAAALAGTGCVETFVGPDGRIWHSTECSSLGECYRTAGDTCQGKYRIEQSRDKTDYNYNFDPKNKSSNMSSYTSTDFVFSCEHEPERN